MNNMNDLDHLMDNFDIKTFWQKRKLGTILAIFVAQNAVTGVLLVRAVLNSSTAGAVPKGMDARGPKIVVR